MLLAEEVVILALDVNKGKIPFSKTTLVDYGISGAILTELAISIIGFITSLFHCSTSHLPLCHNKLLILLG